MTSVTTGSTTLMGFYFFMTYQEQLNDVRWWVRRNEILERDDYCCQDCLRSPRNNISNYIILQVHHFEYIEGRMAWEYEDKYLITLCEECHKKWHNIIPDMRTERQKPVFVYGIRGLKSQEVKHISEAILEFINSLRNG